jgi:hypothetical protein
MDSQCFSTRVLYRNYHVFSAWSLSWRHGAIFVVIHRQTLCSGAPRTAMNFLVYPIVDSISLYQDTPGAHNHFQGSGGVTPAIPGTRAGNQV